MQRKLIKVGTSAAVLVPKEVLKKERVKIGQKVHVAFSRKPRTSVSIDPKVIEWTEKLMKRYAPMLKKLSDA